MCFRARALWVGETLHSTHQQHPLHKAVHPSSRHRLRSSVRSRPCLGSGLNWPILGRRSRRPRNALRSVWGRRAPNRSKICEALCEFSRLETPNRTPWCSSQQRYRSRTHLQHRKSPRLIRRHLIREQRRPALVGVGGGSEVGRAAAQFEAGLSVCGALCTAPTETPNWAAIARMLSPVARSSLILWRRSAVRAR